MRFNNNENSKPNKLVPFVALIAIVCAVYFIFWGVRNHVWLSRPALSEIEHMVDVKFPDDARLVRSLMIGYPHSTLIAKIEISSDDIRTFHEQFSTSKGSEPDEVLPVLKQHAPDVRWWNPDRIKKPLTFFEPGRRLYGVVGLDEKGKSMIYLYQYPR